MQRSGRAVLASTLIALSTAATAQTGGDKPMLTPVPAAPGDDGQASSDPPILHYATVRADGSGATHVQHCTLTGFVLSGRWSVETTDGTVLEQGQGEFQFNAEQGATPQGPERHVGHLTRQVGDVPNVQLIVSLKKGSTATPPACCEPAA